MWEILIKIRSSELEFGPNIRTAYLHLNTASRQDTAYDHINQMGDFFARIRFGRVLPPNHSQHSMGVSGPPYGGLRGHKTPI